MKYKVIKKLPGYPQEGYIIDFGDNDEVKLDNGLIITEKEVQLYPEYFSKYLFVTEDGKEIYEGYNFFSVIKHVDNKGCVSFTIKEKFYEEVCLKFSQRKLAEQYVNNIKKQYKEGNLIFIEGKVRKIIEYNVNSFINDIKCIDEISDKIETLSDYLPFRFATEQETSYYQKAVIEYNEKNEYILITKYNLKNFVNDCLGGKTFDEVLKRYKEVINKVNIATLTEKKRVGF